MDGSVGSVVRSLYFSALMNLGPSTPIGWFTHSSSFKGSYTFFWSPRTPAHTPNMHN